MAELSCDLMDIGQAAAGCDEQFAGIGNQIYVAYPEDLKAPPTYDERKAAFASGAFTFKASKGAWKFRIKKQSGQILQLVTKGQKDTTYS